MTWQPAHILTRTACNSRLDARVVAAKPVPRLSLMPIRKTRPTNPPVAATVAASSAQAAAASVVPEAGSIISEPVIEIPVVRRTLLWTPSLFVFSSGGISSGHTIFCPPSLCNKHARTSLQLTFCNTWMNTCRSLETCTTSRAKPASQRLNGPSFVGRRWAC